MELLVRAGRTPVHAAMMLVPEAWEKYPDVDSDVKAFYEYHQCVIEPWDGPAALAFSDGCTVAAAVDRNGLRPCRYKIRADGMIALGSEVGLVDFDPREVVESGKLGSGETFLVDTQRQARAAIVGGQAGDRDAQAVCEVGGSLHGDASAERWRGTAGDVEQRAASGATRLWLWLRGRAHDPRAHGRNGADAVWSMGDDTPIPPAVHLSAGGLRLLSPALLRRSPIRPSIRCARRR